MPTFVAFMQAIPMFFKFFDELYSIGLMLKATPEEKRQEVLKKIKDEYAQIQATGRPRW